MTWASHPYWLVLLGLVTLAVLALPDKTDLGGH